jgi:MoxR-like ATPase
MPTDVVGTEILEEDHATGRRFFKFQRGPVFAHIVLADEINRTPPKTQAALLEAMQETAVTYGGTTYPLERPFFVLATQNPLEQTGTYPLPEAQLDRFLLHVRIGYPSEQEELDILRRTTGRETAAPAAVLGGDEILAAQALAREVRVSDALFAWAARLVRATRPEQTGIAFVREWTRWGASPRAGQSLVLAAKARALLHGRLAVALDDLRHVAFPVLRHRLIVNFRAEAEGISPDDVTKRLLAEVEEPRSPLA